ncbi:hypothetical protein [Salinibaculum salinum]|uniref:hypothetical protein n=1 Tax=Salinibaculum salinum TaxID=3131996 RepID=UPI0030EF8FB8
MSQKTLSHLSDEVTQEQNQTGITSPVLVVDPEDGTLIHLHNRVSSGDAVGLPIFGKFRDSDGNPLPTDTKLVLRALRPTDHEPVVVAVAESNISPWNQLSTSEQRNEENIDQVKIELKGDHINIRDKDFLRIEMESDTQIDWSNSELYFARNGVSEHPFEG